MDTRNESGKILLSDKEAAKLLSMGTSTLWRGVKSGEFPAPVKIGGMTRWRVADLHRYVEGLASQPTTASTPAAG